MDPETMETQEALDEAFENIAILEPPSNYPTDDDWMPGEFDIT